MSLTNENCQQRQPRKVCHTSFWCGDDRAYAINQSRDGMCFRTAKRVETGQIVKIHQGPSLEVNGRVAWTRRLADCTEVGVQFLGKPKSLESWRLFLNSGSVSESKGPNGEPVLALPAPGQTFVPSSRLQVNFRSGFSSPRNRSGTSWQQAMRFSEHEG